MIPTSKTYEYIAHQLRLVGVIDKPGKQQHFILLANPDKEQAEKTRNIAAAGRIVLALMPTIDFGEVFKVDVKKLYQSQNSPQRKLTCTRLKSRLMLKSLFPVKCFSHPEGESLVTDQSGKPIWLSLPVDRGYILFIGTELANDIARYRQGDPFQAFSRPTEAIWGIPGERPNYLFNRQLVGLPRYDRQADFWIMILAEFLAEKTGKALDSILPGRAPGAVVVTGDDDQAYLEKYEEQLTLLREVPITYFLHPKTRHTRESIRRMKRRHKVEFGIHPDALDAPEKYSELLDEQVAWFREITGSSPRSVRNHGFLNNGYWGHLNAWIRNGIEISSNVPGVDGTIINGSLLPARVSHEGLLTQHWSILTAIGDGVRFALGKNGPESAQCIFDLADAIKKSGLPGIIIFNLHPQNVAETREMHAAVVELIHDGFISMTMGECLDWFLRRDCGMPPRMDSTTIDRMLWLFKRFLRRPFKAK